ncbi:hypothetical protein [Lentibacillus saliphilus]|uniref:hypothetical protein n=1 Tax=Lentibacillus saliphilus TaxID=2737028 RepID=UPI001C309B92|nr:hypothetical protein [Lentibacillus saliphilus]
MLKEAIKFLFESGIEPHDRIVEFSDQDNKDRIFFVDDSGVGKEVKPTNNRANQALELNTLTGLVTYIKSKLERSESPLFLHVKNEKKVVLKGLLEFDGGREDLAVANAIVPEFDFDYFHDVESMNIAFQSKFTKTEDRNLLLKVIGSLKEDNVRHTGDDGVSQAVTIQTGVASADDVLVPNPVTLAPYRTFLEVDQPESDFVFRMKDGPRGAIFEADGGAWRNIAIANVRDYLAKELEAEISEKRITIIA